MTHMEKFLSGVEARSIVQSRVNDVFVWLNDSVRRDQVTRETILVAAETAWAEFPQYRGYWDQWKLVRVVTELKSKSGVLAEAGDVVLCKVENVGIGERVERTTICSIRCRVNAIVPNNSVRCVA